MKKTKQLEYWTTDFGNEYTKRNSDLALFSKRLPFFRHLLEKNSDIQSILEVGCNSGGNLYVLNKINPHIKLFGVEPNKNAALIARQRVSGAEICNKSIFDIKNKNAYDLVFTSGVLIHIADGDIKKTLENIYMLSRKYILTVEYYAKKRETIPYRDLYDALFKRPYNKEWLKIDPTMQLVASGYIGKNDGFDDCHWWLYKKQ